jgi:hypothetical protein
MRKTDAQEIPRRIPGNTERCVNHTTPAVAAKNVDEPSASDL